MTRTRLLGQQERGREKQRERTREVGYPWREESWAPREGEAAGISGAAEQVQWVQEGLRRQESIGAFGAQ